MYKYDNTLNGLSNSFVSDLENVVEDNLLFWEATDGEVKKLEDELTRITKKMILPMRNLDPRDQGQVAVSLFSDDRSHKELLNIIYTFDKENGGDAFGTAKDFLQEDKEAFFSAYKLDDNQKSRIDQIINKKQKKEKDKPIFQEKVKNILNPQATSKEKKENFIIIEKMLIDWDASHIQFRNGNYKQGHNKLCHRDITEGLYYYGYSNAEIDKIKPQFMAYLNDKRSKH